MNAMLRVRPAVAAPGGWTLPLAGLALGLLVLGLLFRVEIAAAVATWDRSAAYTHCWLVLPIAAWLAWSRRDRLRALRPRPSLLLALPALAGAAAWLVAERLGIMEGRQLVLVVLVWVLVLATLGWRIALAMAAPLAYLIFAVPFGEFLTPLLQDLTLRMIEFGLQATGVPHYIDGLIIEIPSGTFLVAEACAGLRFLIAALAFGALYALVMFRSPGRRLLVMVMALVVPVLANGVRAFGIVLYGHYLGNAEAAAADHLVYGWGFFSIVLLLLVLAGLPFREDGVEAAAPTDALASLRPVQAVPGPRLLAKSFGAAALVAVLASVGPLAAAGLDGGVAPPRTLPAALRAADGCEAEGLALRCDGALVTARLLVFDPATNWAAVAGARRATLDAEDDAALAFNVTGPNMAWQARQEPRRPALVAVAAWRDGQSTGDGLRARLAQALSGLRGGTASPVLAVVEFRPGAGGVPSQSLRNVLAAQAEGLAAQAARLSLPK
jgi:exosortase A